MKNVEFIDIGNIGFLASCGFCILMVCARGARHTKGKTAESDISLRVHGVLARARF